ncbi:MAG: protein translocase subunit SecF [Thermoanaerobaculia bacterium]
MELFHDPNYHWVKYRNYAVIGSLVFILTGFASFFWRGLNLGIDFSGGASIVVKFAEQVPVQTLRSHLPDATIQRYGAPEDNTVLIRLPEQKGEGDYAGRVVNQLYGVINGDVGNKIDLNFKGRDTLSELLMQNDPDSKGSGPQAETYYADLSENIIAKRSELGIFTSMSQVTSIPGVSSATARVLSEHTMLGKMNVLNQETVGPQVGRELKTKAILAVILSTLAIGAYITIRFDLKFGIGAVVALTHDVFAAFAFLIMIHAEVSLLMIAAFLMIVGYSVNDTVVTYDRVRENQRKSRVKQPFAEILDLSINQTLSRTILTSGSVVLVLIALIVFGGEVIHDFAWILLIGVIAGTYSTLMIVTAFVIWWERHITKGDVFERGESRAAAEAKGKNRVRA